MNIEVKHPTDMYHIKLTFEDTFSFAKTTRTTTVSGATLLKMQNDIGKVVINKFNHKTHTRDTLKLTKIERA